MLKLFKKILQMVAFFANIATILAAWKQIKELYYRLSSLFEKNEK